MPFVRRLLVPVAAAGALAVTGAGIAQAAPSPEVGGSFTCENDTYTATYGGLQSSGPIDCSALTAQMTPGPAVSGSDIAGTTAPAASPADDTSTDAPADDTSADAPADDTSADDQAAQPVG